MSKKQNGKAMQNYREEIVQNTSVSEEALHNRKQKKAFRQISSVLSILLAVVLFYTLMKPAITMENRSGSGEEVQLICGLAEHAHTEACYGYDHEEADPVYAVHRELECPFVPHVHDETCYDASGNLICGISEEYYHVHDENCYDLGTLVCNLAEHKPDTETETQETRVLICGRPESTGHVHSDSCYAVTYLTNEQPVCGKEESGPHTHSEDCYGLVLICNEDHEHTDECFTEGLVCGLEEGPGHVHSLECYPSIRQLACGMEESEGHVHTEECYAYQTITYEPHVHTDACYVDGTLVCGLTEIQTHQHTDACWNVTQVLISGGHRHNKECEKVLLCQLPEHEHTRECYSGKTELVEEMLQSQAMELTGETLAGEGTDAATVQEDNTAAEEAQAQEEKLNEEASLAAERVQTEAGVVHDDALILVSEEGEQDEEQIAEEYDLVNEDPEWDSESASAEEQAFTQDQAESIENEDTSLNVPEESADQPEAGMAEGENQAVPEAGDKETEPVIQEETETEPAAETELTNNEAGTETPGEPVNPEEPVSGEQDQFTALNYVTNIVRTDDGQFSVQLHTDEGVRVQDVLKLAGLEAEQVSITSDIAFLEIGEDYFACRFAFDEGRVYLTAGETEITVLCTFVSDEDVQAAADADNEGQQGTEGQTQDEAGNVDGISETSDDNNDDVKDSLNTDETGNTDSATAVDESSKEENQAEGNTDTENAGEEDTDASQTLNDGNADADDGKPSDAEDGKTVDGQSEAVSDETDAVSDGSESGNQEELTDGMEETADSANSDAETGAEGEDGSKETTDAVDAENQAAEEQADQKIKVLLNGEATDQVRAELDIEDAQALMAMVQGYLQAEQGNTSDDTTEENDEVTEAQIWRVLRVSSEDAFEGRAEITVPVNEAFASVIPEHADMTSVNYRVFRVDAENGEVISANDFTVNDDAEFVKDFTLGTDETGVYAFVCTVSYVYREYQAEIELDLSDFIVVPEELSEDSGISVLTEGAPENLPAQGSMMRRQTMSKQLKKMSSAPAPEASGVVIDMQKLMDQLEAQGIDTESEFAGIRMSMNADEGTDMDFSSMSEESSDGNVSFDGQSLKIMNNGTVVLKGKHITVTVRIVGFHKAGETSTYEFAFGENKSLYMSEIFSNVGMPENFVPARFNFTLSDDSLVSLAWEENDCLVTANDFFDEVTLNIERGWYRAVILLRNIKPVEEEKTEIWSEDGTVSVTLKDAIDLPEGTKPAAVPSEGVDIHELLTADFGDNADVQLKWFDISLGDVHEISATVTLPGVIELPENPENRVMHVAARVYHVREDGIYVLDAAVNGSDITFETDGFSEFGIAWVVTFENTQTGETYTLTLPAAEDIPLAEVLKGIGLAGDSAAEAEGEAQTDTESAVEFEKRIKNVESTNADTVLVTKTEESWIIRIVKEGDALIAITLDDDTVIVIDVNAHGVTEKTSADESVVISTVNKLYLPEDADVKAELVDDAAAETAIEAVKAENRDSEIAETTEEAGKTAYTVFDISLENVDVDAYDGFKVKVQLPEKVVGKDFRLYHIHDGKIEEIEIENLGLALTGNGQETVAEFSFETKNFSEFVLSYTVDFHYEGVDYSIPGESQILLSELIDILNITDESGTKIDVADVVDVSFSDERLVTVEQVSGLITYNDAEGIDVGEKDFLLTSLEPFTSDEVLTITLTSGEIIEVAITDATYVTDISELLKTITVNGTDYSSGGSGTVAPGDNLSIKLDFREQGLTKFDRTGPLTYQLPSGLKLPGGNEGDLIPGDANLAAIYSIHYTITEAGEITFDWVVKDGKQEDFEALDGIFIQMDIDVTVDGENGDTIHVGEGTLTVKDEHDLGVSKSGTYDSATNQMVYTVVVTSTGDNRSIDPITITDTISGTALSLVDGSATIDYGITDDKIDFNYDTTNKKVVATITGGMTGGQSISFKYRADVNLDTLAAAGGSQGKYGTPATTGNSVTVSGFDVPDANPDNDTSTHSVDHTIQFSTASKTGESGEFENGKRTVNWQITANTEHNKGITYISDAMGNGKDKMNYSGDGITVYVYNRSGTLVTSYPVSWETLEVQKEAVIDPETNQVTKAKSEGWRYTIPTDYQTADYSFMVDYSTAVDVSGAITTTDVSNTVNTDYAQGGTSAKAEPAPGYKLTFDKSVAEDGLDIPNRTVDWDISFDVPASGLGSAVITDTLPTTAGSGLGDFYDGYDSYTYEGLKDGETIEESFETTTVGDETVKTKVIFTFYKLNNEGEKVPGLYPSNESRKVTVHLRTTLNEDWLNSTPDSSTAYAYLNHKNQAVLVADNITLQDDATVQVDNTEPTTAKSGMKFNKELAYSESSLRHEATAYLPAYQYEVFLYNIDESCFNDDKLVIDDAFEGKYLKYYQLSDEATGTEGHIVSNDSNIVNMNGSTPESYGKNHQKLDYVDESNNGHTVTIPDADVNVQNGRVIFTLPRSLFPTNSEGEFYKQYSVKYLLFVKNPTALELLKQDTIAAGGVKQLNNTAFVAGKMEGTSTVKYEVPISTKSYETVNAGEGKYHFTIDVNPNAKTFGNGFLTVTDTYKNLTVDYDSIQCEPKGALLNLNHSDNTITYVVKNSTHVVITYDALAVKSGDFSNDVVINGTKSSASGTATITSRGSTGTDKLQLTVQKHAAGNMLELLEGVKFKLYLYDENAENHYGTQVNGPGADNCWVTDAEGKIKFILPVLRDENDAVTDTTAKYILHEVGNLPGYKPLPHDYVFTIDRQNVNYGQYIYLDKDTMPIANEPEEEDELTVTVEKEFKPDVSPKPRVTIHLYEKEGRLVDKSDSDRLVETVTLPVTDPVTNEQSYTYAFEHLPSGKAYYVVEDLIPGYVVSYSGNNGLGLDHSGAIKVTNSPFEISVEKKWLDSSDVQISDAATLEQLPDVTVHLYKDGQLVDGKDKVLKASEGYTASWSGLVAGDYTVVEEATGEQVSIIYTDENENMVSSLDNIGGSIVITNKVQPVTVKKIWNDNNNADGNRPASVSVTLLKDGNAVSTKQLTVATNWEAVWYGLSADGNYTFSEANVQGYEQESIVYKDAAGYSYYHKTNYNNEVPYDPETGEIIWNGPTVPYTTAQMNGTVELTNKPVEIDDTKTQVIVNKVWNNGTIDLTTEQAAEAGLSATVKLIEYRTPVIGTTVKFVDWDNRNVPDAEDIVVGSGSVTIAFSNTVKVVAVTELPEHSYQLEQKKIGGDINNSKNNITFDATSPIVYIVRVSSWGGAKPEVDLSNSILPQAGDAITDGPFDVTGKTLTLAGPDYSGTFYNLDRSRLINGTVYNLTYAVAEILPDSGYAIDYKVGDGEYKDALAAEDAVGGAGTKTITVKNTKTEPQTGTLKLAKAVKVNGIDPVGSEKNALVEGVYTFTITGQGTSPDTHYVRVKVEDDNGTLKISYWSGEEQLNNEDDYTYTEQAAALVEDLAAGEYTVTEQTPANGSVLSGVTINNEDTTLNGNSFKVTVVADDTEGAQANVVVTNNKNTEQPTVKKTVWDVNDSTGIDSIEENSEKTYNDTADHDMDDDIKFRIECPMPDNPLTAEVTSYPFTLYDNMNGLKYKSGRVYFVVYHTDEDESDYYDVTDSFTMPAVGANKLSVTPSVTGGLAGINSGYLVDDIDPHALRPERGEKSFAIPEGSGEEYTFKSTDTLTRVEFRYLAQFDNPTIGSAGNLNETWFTYGVGGVSSHDYNRVFTYQLEVKKTDGANLLPGAIFSLYKDITGQPVTSELKVDERSWELVSTIPSTEAEAEAGAEGGSEAETGGEAEAETVTTFTWTGIDDGIYRLVETPPEGYHPVPDILFEIKAKHENNAAVNDNPKLVNMNDTSAFTDGYTATADPATGKITITKDGSNPAGIVNEPYETKVKLIKVADGTETKLSGAVFGIYTVTIYGQNGTPYSVGGINEKMTDENGELEFTQLAPGRYKIEEITPPYGYTKVEGNVFYIDVNENGNVSWLIADPDEGTWLDPESEDDVKDYLDEMNRLINEKKISYAPASGDDPATFTVGNPPITVDVPIDKSWDDDIDNNSAYTWTITLQLEESKEHVSGPVYDGANTVDDETNGWAVVPGYEEVVISSNSTADEKTIENLPMYHTYPNGGVYRYIYSATETAYELKLNGETVSKWDDTNGLTVGSDQYVPNYWHDAGDKHDTSGIGEDHAEFYHLKISNSVTGRPDVTDTITNLSLKKTWEEGAFSAAGVTEEEAFAKFELRRYVAKEYREYVEPDPATTFTVTLNDKNGDKQDEITVIKGSRIRLVATFNGFNGEVPFQINGSDNGDLLINANGQGSTGYVMFTVDQNLTISPYQYQYYNVWDQNPVSEMHLSTTSGASDDPAPDTVWNNNALVYTLRKDHWTETIPELPLREISEIDESTGQQTIKIYSYYFAEVDSNPKDYYAIQTDDSGNPIGYSDSRIDTNDVVVNARNKPKPKLVVEKIWRGVPKTDGFPTVKFNLYKKGANNQQDQLLYENIELKSTPDKPETDYRWECPDVLDEDGDYYVIETTKNGHVDNLTWVLYGYSSFDGEEDPGESGYRIGRTQADDDAKKAYVDGNEGTIRIHNKFENYLEFDIMKKWLELRPEGTGGSWYTTTSFDYMKRNLVFGFKVIRRTRRNINGSFGTFADYSDQVANNDKWQNDRQYIIYDWEEIGDELLAGYDAEGNTVANNSMNNFYLQADSVGGDWHFRIHENKGQLGDNFNGGDNIGLPAYGIWLNPETNQYEVVLYEYSVREVGVYKNLNRDPYERTDWFMSVTPPYSREVGGDHEPFPRMVLQDQNRIINYQASNLRVRKEWYGSGKTDVEEVYLKIYRKRGSEEWADFTQTIVEDKVNNHNWQNYVDAENIDETNGWLILRPDGKDNELIIHKLLMYEAGVDGTNPYEYAVQEVGYKRKGVVYSNPSDLQLLEPRYDLVIGTYIEGMGMMVDFSKVGEYDAAATEGELPYSGQTTIYIGNNPELDLKVRKTWQKADGTAYTPEPGTEVTFKIRQVRKNKTTNATVESYVSIGGETVLKLQKTGKEYTVRQNVPAYDETAHPYPASENPSGYTIVSTKDASSEWTYYVDGLLGGYVDAEMQEWSCTYYIEEVGASGFDITMEGNDGIDESGKTVKIINTKNDKGALNIIKKVETGSPADTTDTFTYQVVLTPDSDTTIDVAKITFNGTGKVSGQTFAPENPGKGVAVTITVSMQGTGKLTIGNIPKNTTYEVTELTDNMPEGWSQVGEVEYSDPNKKIAQEEYTDTATVTNKQNEQNVDIVKVDATNMTTPLSGAKFTLKELDPEGTGTYKVDGITKESDVTANDGKTSFTGIRAGYYEISETKVPDGYVLLDSDKFYMKVMDGEITRIRKVETDDANTPDKDESVVKNWPEAEETNMISFTSAQAAVVDDPATTDVNEAKDATNATFTVGNTPGATLPSTGGPGTKALYLLGSMLIMLASAGFILHGRKKRVE